MTLAVLFGLSLTFRGAFAFVGALKLRRLRHDEADVPGSAGAAAV